MNKQSPGPTTPAQRAEALRLHQGGHSIRMIAAEVFGDAKYRGRVERIIATTNGGFSPPLAGEQPSLDGLAPIEAIRILYERRLAVLLAAEAPPSMAELQKLLDVQRRLDAYAQYERLRDLTREPE